MSITTEQINADLRKCGIHTGDRIMLHSSLKSIGWVEGGAEGVIRGCTDAVGPEGLIAVPTLSHTRVENPHPDNPAHAWDKTQTPSRVGKITDVLWRMPGACRSDHPTHSVAAIGRNAAEFVKNHSWDQPTLSEDSPYGQIVKQNFKIMFLGINMASNTTLHAFEEWMRLPYMAETDIRLGHADGTEEAVHITGYPSGCRGFYGRRATHVSDFVEAAGITSKGTVGEADIILIEARSLADLMLAQLYREPDFLLCRRDPCSFCEESRKMIHEEIEAIRSRLAVLAEMGLYNGPSGAALL